MKPRLTIRKEFKPSLKQRGVVLFFALIALVVMSLAAVALIRSVDTSTMISGNLAFKQAATTSGDAGTEAAMAWLTTEQAAMIAQGKILLTDATHTFNVSSVANAALGYYSSVRPTIQLTDGTLNWNATDSKLVGSDASGNTVRYIIERMCTTANQTPSLANCLFATSTSTLNDQKVLAADEVCQGAGCLPNSQSTQLRITVRIAGPKNTVSYIQSFVY